VGEESLAVQKRYLGIRSKVRNGRKGDALCFPFR
jgi:hypothetical protein